MVILSPDLSMHGSTYFYWSKGCKPGNAIGVDCGRLKPILLPAKNRVNGVSIACPDITIPKLTITLYREHGLKHS